MRSIFLLRILRREGKRRVKHLGGGVSLFIHHRTEADSIAFQTGDNRFPRRPCRKDKPLAVGKPCEAANASKALVLVRFLRRVGNISNCTAELRRRNACTVVLNGYITPVAVNKQMHTALPLLLIQTFTHCLIDGITRILNVFAIDNDGIFIHPRRQRFEYTRAKDSPRLCHRPHPLNCL